jgi:hypothetical protein
MPSKEHIDQTPEHTVILPEPDTVQVTETNSGNALPMISQNEHPDLNQAGTAISEKENLSLSSRIRSRWNNIRNYKYSNTQKELLCWGSMAVIGAAYPFTGGVNEHVLDVSKQIAEMEGLLGLGALEIVGFTKIFREIRKRT